MVWDQEHLSSPVVRVNTELEPASQEGPSAVIAETLASQGVNGLIGFIVNTLEFPGMFLFERRSSRTQQWYE